MSGEMQAEHDRARLIRSRRKHAELHVPPRYAVRFVGRVQDEVYRLSLRMLWHPQDAEDATQEILFRIITSVATFRGESTFRTWALRVATNHLLNVRRSRIERQSLTFDAFGKDLADGLVDPGEAPAPRADEADQPLLEEEVRIGCTQAMLLCLDRDERIAYILGERPAIDRGRVDPEDLLFREGRLRLRDGCQSWRQWARWSDCTRSQPFTRAIRRTRHLPASPIRYAGCCSRPNGAS